MVIQHNTPKTKNMSQENQESQNAETQPEVAEVKQPEVTEVETSVKQSYKEKAKAVYEKAMQGISVRKADFSYAWMTGVMVLASLAASTFLWAFGINSKVNKLEADDQQLEKTIASLADCMNTMFARVDGKHEALSATVAKQINELQADSKAMQDEVLLLVQSEAHNQEVARLKREEEELKQKLLAEKPTGFAGMLASIKNKFK
jgi:hypothetical protein